MPVNFDALVIGPCMRAFAEPVQYQPQVGAPFAVEGVFDEAYQALLPLGGAHGIEPLAIGGMAGTDSTGPALGVRLTSFTALPASPPTQGDQLTVRGKPFLVRDVRPDGLGGAMLLLVDAEAGP